MENIVSTDQSRTIQTRIVLPPDTNHLDSIFGGKVLAYIDEVAALAAMKHSRCLVVTASIDSVHFLSSAKVGDILTLEGYVVSTGRTSMEVYVKVESEDLLTGQKAITTTSFLTMVAMDSNSIPTEVPRVLPQTLEEEKRFEEAQLRKKIRKQNQKMTKGE
ncbi:acyl-CoA thioesterase [Bacillus sp. 2205SS5-2]|uniref:acyl-CoA thioesterase n=1 Tax=Bacillus sp. 2205SS5-2 TaxID=3109031 RepID=UPI0030072E14